MTIIPNVTKDLTQQTSLRHGLGNDQGIAVAGHLLSSLEKPTRRPATAREHVWSSKKNDNYINGNFRILKWRYCTI